MSVALARKSGATLHFLQTTPVFSALLPLGAPLDEEVVVVFVVVVFVVFVVFVGLLLDASLASLSLRLKMLFNGFSRAPRGDLLLDALWPDCAVTLLRVDLVAQLSQHTAPSCSKHSSVCNTFLQLAHWCRTTGHTHTPCKLPRGSPLSSLCVLFCPQS